MAVVALTAACAAVGCRRTTDARTASPRAAAKAFAAAMAGGDAAAVGQVSTGDDASLHALAASAALNASYARLERAATDRFGDPKAVIGVGRGADHYAKLLPDLDAAPEAVQADRATVGTGLRKIHVKKVGEAWRVDRSLHVPPGDPSGHVAMIRAMAAAYDDVTAGLTAGAYESADAAKAALMGKTMQAVLSQVPASGPATRAAGGSAAVPPAATRPAGTVPTGPAATESAD